MVREKQVAKKSICRIAPPGSNKRMARQPGRANPSCRGPALEPNWLREIRRLQKSTETVIPKITFQRVVRQIAVEMGCGDFKWQRLALIALQEASEMYMCNIFDDTNSCAIHARRVTIFPRDIWLVLRLRNGSL